MTPSRELAFIDSRLPDIAVLLGNLRPDVEAIVLDAGVPAPAQIAAALEQRPRSAAVHILAHGRPGEISFASGALSRTTLSEHAEDLARIGRALNRGGLNLWSCCTAEGEAGSTFTEALAEVAGAPVAASTGLVGAAALGGCWTLECRVGDAKVRMPLTDAGSEAYSAVLETKTWTKGSSGLWGEAGNWTPSGVPQDGDDAIVNEPGSIVTIEADTGILASLQLVTEVFLNGVTLDASGIGGTGIQLDGQLIGYGSVLGPVAGTGLISASNGTLTLSGTVASGPSFEIYLDPIAPVAATLKFTGTATAASAIIIDDADQTLEVGAGGNLTIDAAEDITNGKLELSGGTLTDTLGLTIGNGATLSGFGTVTTDVTVDGGTISVDALDGEGGSTLEIDGKLTNIGVVTVGNDTLSGAATLTADAIDNDCGCGELSVVGRGSDQATVDIASAAGFGTVGTLVGDVELSGNALLEFATGTITTIESVGSLWLNGALAHINAADDIEDNSVLKGLALNEGGLRLSDGASVTTDGALVNDGGIFIDGFWGEGGSTLEIGGKLTNVGIVAVGNETLTGPVALTADSIDNDCGCGLLSITGGDTEQATVTVASEAGFGTDGILIGAVELSGNALLEFAGGGAITTIDLFSYLWLDGAQARVAVAGALDSNSALAGLTDIQGTLDLTDGAEVVLTGTLSNSGFLQVDGSPGDPGGSALTIGGALVNNGVVALGNVDMSRSATISTNALFNLSSGAIYIDGNQVGDAQLDVLTSAFNDGVIYVDAGGVLDVGGEFHMYDWSELTVERRGALVLGGATTVHAGGLLDIDGDLEIGGASRLTVQSGGILTTGARTRVLKVGAGTTSVIDLRGQSFESQYKIVVQSGALQFIGTAGTSTPELIGAGIIQGEVSLDGGSNVLTITPTGFASGTSRVYHFYHTDLALAYTTVIAANGNQSITGSDFGETLTAGKYDDLVVGGAAADTLYGLAGADTLYGLAGNDLLDGGVGADAMSGGDGDDTYYVDNGGDEVFEAVGEGNDTVYSKVDYALEAGEEIEFLRASGSAGLTLTGNVFDNTVVGGAGIDTLYGLAGNDRLNGAAGADAMSGGDGNDAYYVNEGGDKVFEAVGEGIDTVYSKVDYALAAGEEIEVLRVSGSAGLILTGNEFNNTVAGGAGIDTLYGLAGNDKLNGAAGADAMSGGDGNDTYYVNEGGDEVFEAVGEGIDTVYSKVDYALAAGEEIEVLRASGSAGLNLIANEFDNTLVGGVGNDLVNGGLGDDHLTGGGGNDTFAFDTAFGAGLNIDLVADFASGSDLFQLDSTTYFAGLPSGQLDASRFSSSGSSGTDPQIVYDQSTGALFYDSNGAVAGGASQFATVAGKPTLTASDFWIV